MKNHKIIFNTKNPLWLNNGWRILAFITAAITILIDFMLLTVHAITIRNLSNLAYPLLLMILPFGGIAIKFLLQAKYYFPLKKVVRAASLIDYDRIEGKSDTKKIVNAVKIEVEQCNNIIYITFLTNGIKNHENVRQLSDILSDVLKMNCEKTYDLFGKVTYKLYKMPEFGKKVSDYDFF
ncbi:MULTISPECIES: hypothetical protein [unclassified Lactobacillus]|uniref:hypothetical protein n=1 Tax=unclassified Lactobacillus TaxID=2620435 RepID=UPI000EFC9317|nr:MULTISPECIES: hypothetical protein [unclassified Lactobacillus]RMC26297.1 hypothetical protein F5ESL0247_00095 [Lactobacillus sp. ESL0247]RMC29835.1 hypothetical protein F5ESL0246_00095 [Lactobacillus sp. ESL0246]RMC34492.1 hypothetical protein F5ESL0245_00095 [Lactobacillus sp. ESL0245]